MNGDLFAVDDAATPLTEEEKEGLIPSFIAFRHELNAVEQENILRAEHWALGRKRQDVLNEKFLRALHKRMFGDVWRWAGTFRKTARNIGVEAWRISVELRKLVDDTHYWMTYETYAPDELAARFHHRLVWIHPFPNGNGRHARLAADLLLRQLGQPRFSWGSAGLITIGQTRQSYVEALRQADTGNIGLLLAFVRS